MIKEFSVLLLMVFCLFGCSSKEQKEQTETPSVTAPAPIKTDKPATDSRNQATVFDKPLWDISQMEKQVLYCVDQYIDMEEIDPYKFCECFLSKARYTHEIRFLDQAFEDQEGWLLDCMRDHPRSEFREEQN